MQRTCESCESAVTDPTAAFCSRCGSPVREASGPSDRTVHELQARFEDLEDQLAGLAGPYSSWRWKNLTENERWTVWWGVAWRGLVIYLAIAALLYVIVAANT